MQNTDRKPNNNLIPEKDYKNQILWLKKRCYDNRINSLKCVKWAGSGHMGGAFSCSEILGTLYFWSAVHNPQDPHWDTRDRIILSKGHASPMLYSVLSSAGYFPEEDLKTFRKLGSKLGGHPEYGLEGVEAPSGSLGQGFSIALGMALGIKYNGGNSKVYAIIGDGELQEGQCWEVIMSASAKKLDNFITILDYNGVQQDGFVKDAIPMDPIEDKFKSFLWDCRVVDGHNIEELIEAFEWADHKNGKPKIIIAKTLKGKGVSYMENVPKWHGTQPPNDELFAQAIKELENKRDNIL